MIIKDCILHPLTAMILLAGMDYEIGASRQLPAAVALAGSSNVASGVRPDAVPPIAARDGSKAISDGASGASGEPADPRDRRASTPVANSDASGGCGWKLVYERELKQVFLDLVERDSDEVVMRIPHESLVRYLRGVAEAESVRRSAATGEAPLDLLA